MIWMPWVNTMACCLRYCIFLKWCLCEYSHETEVLSESSCLLLWSFCLQNMLWTVPARKKKKKLLMGLSQMLSICIYLILPLLPSSSISSSWVKLQAKRLVFHIFDLMLCFACIAQTVILTSLRSSSWLAIPVEWTWGQCVERF